MMRSSLSLAAALLLAGSSAALAVATISQDAPPDLTAIKAKIKAKDFVSARNDLFKLLNDHEHADVFNLLGFSLRKTGDYANALKYYERALELNPEHLGAHEYIGELFVETNQMPRAKAHLEVLVRLCPSGCEEREDLEKAIADAEKKK